MKMSELSMSALECASRMKYIFDSEGRTEIYKPEVDVGVPSVYAELERAHIILKYPDPSFVVFVPEAYASALRAR